MATSKEAAVKASRVPNGDAGRSEASVSVVKTLASELSSKIHKRQQISSRPQIFFGQHAVRMSPFLADEKNFVQKKRNFEIRRTNGKTILKREEERSIASTNEILQTRQSRGATKTERSKPLRFLQRDQSHDEMRQNFEAELLRGKSKLRKTSTERQSGPRSMPWERRHWSPEPDNQPVHGRELSNQEHDGQDIEVEEPDWEDLIDAKWNFPEIDALKLLKEIHELDSFYDGKENVCSRRTNRRGEPDDEEPPSIPPPPPPLPPPPPPLPSVWDLVKPESNQKKDIVRKPVVSASFSRQKCSTNGGMSAREELLEAIRNTGGLSGLRKQKKESVIPDERN